VGRSVKGRGFRWEAGIRRWASPRSRPIDMDLSPEAESFAQKGRRSSFGVIAGPGAAVVLNGMKLPGITVRP